MRRKIKDEEVGFAAEKIKREHRCLFSCTLKRRDKEVVFCGCVFAFDEGE